MNSTTHSPTKTKSTGRSGRSDSGSASDSKNKKKVRKDINMPGSGTSTRKLIRRTSSLPEIEDYKIPFNTPKQERKSVHLPTLNWDAEFLESSELAENRKVAIKSTRPKHRTNGVMSLMTRTSPRKAENNIVLQNSSTVGAAMNLSLDPNLDPNARKRFSDTSDRIDSYTSSTNYSASIREELQHSFTSFKTEMHLEFNKMRQEMRDLINEKAVNENWLKEVQELREAVQMSPKKRIKRTNGNKDENKDLKFGSLKSKESPRKRINFLENESAAASTSSKKGTLKRGKKQENTEHDKPSMADIYSKYDKMSSSAHSMVLADLHQNTQNSNTNQNLNSTASYKELLEYQLKEKSQKYRKAKKKLKKKNKRIKQLEEQAEEWRKKCLALLEANSHSISINSDANNRTSNNVNKPK